MFATLASVTVLASSILMPPVLTNDNPWAENNWAPLKAQYQVCAETSRSSFSAYVCMTKAHTVATSNLKEA